MDITKFAILKKLAGGGGGSGNGDVMIVTFTFDTETQSVTADKTVDEVYSAMQTKAIIGVLTAGDTIIPLGSCCANSADIEGYPSFMPFVANGKLFYLISSSSSSGSWAYNGSLMN